MHKFIDNIVAFSLKNKFFIFFCTVIAVIAGCIRETGLSKPTVYKWWK